MKYSKDSLLNPSSTRIVKSFQQLSSLRRLNGGYLAAPNPGSPAGAGRYDVFWLRDIMYATYANEYLGSMDDMIQSFELIITILLKHKSQISEGIRRIPEQCALHARFHPNTLEEMTDEWGHHQLDVLGLFLYKTGDLIKKGFEILQDDEQVDLVKDIIQYLFTHRWETIPDYGVWEEGPELHSSSIGSVLAGLTMWFDDGHYDYKYKHNIKLHKIVQVSERYFDTGWDAFNTLLPRESASREHDFAQLSLIWPYNIVNDEMKHRILENIEKNLVQEEGVIRYRGDLYFNAYGSNPDGNEARWPLGLAWLAIVHNKLASWNHDLNYSRTHLQKAREYLLQLDDVMIDGALPELYFGGKANENRPLAWAHSFHIIALQSFINTLEELRKKHHVDFNEELGIL